MNNILNILDRMLHFNPRIKNVICTIFFALINSAIFIPYIATTAWYTSIVNIHTSMSYAVVVGFFVLIWLAAWMIYTFIAWVFCCIKNHRDAVKNDISANNYIESQLSTLSDRQSKLLFGMVMRGKHQIQEHEIGGYNLVWEDEMRVLINKGIMKQHFATYTYEITPDYFQYIKDNWEPETGNSK